MRRNLGHALSVRRRLSRLVGPRVHMGLLGVGRDMCMCVGQEVAVSGLDDGW